MHGGHGAFVTGIHGLEHVERLFSAHFADDYAIGAHTQAVDKELPLADGSCAFDVGRPGFQAHDVFLREPQFGGIFNRHETLARGNVLRKDVEKCRLTGTGAAGDHDADAGAHRCCEHLHHLRRDAFQLDQLIGR
jgi:hypothetical protein